MIGRTIKSGAGGLLTGAALGVLLALADCLRAAVGVAWAVPPGKWGITAVWYAALGAATGLVVGFVAGVLRRDARPMYTGVLVALAGVVAAWLTAHAYYRGAHADPVPLLVTLGVLAGGAVAAVILWRWRLPRFGYGVWVALLVLGGIASFGVDVVGVPSKSPVPVVTETEAEHPPVLFIVIDTLRADHLSLYGYERDTSPVLDRFSEEGLTYDRAYAPSPWTKPSVPTLLTGLSPGVHGLESWSDLLPESAVTIAEQFDAAGYRTGLFADNFFVSCRFRHDQGFDEVMDRVGGPGLERWRLPGGSFLGYLVSEVFRKHPSGLAPGYTTDRHEAPGINEGFLAWLDEIPEDEPWFAYLHYVEPHSPYAPPAPWNRKYPLAHKGGGHSPSNGGFAPFENGDVLPPEEREAFVDAYDASIAYWDHCFGELLDELETRGRSSDVVFLITADHGEAFYEHGTWAHRRSLYDEVIHVPLVIRGPGIAKGRVRETVPLEGIPNTLLSLAGFSAEEDEVRPRGEPIYPPPEADRECHARLIYSGFLQQSVVLGGKKWILARRGDETVTQAFDLEVDPGETADLASGREEAAREIQKKLDRRAELQMGLRLSAESADGAAKLADDMKGMGYLK